MLNAPALTVFRVAVESDAPTTRLLSVISSPGITVAPVPNVILRDVVELNEHVAPEPNKAMASAVGISRTSSQSKLPERSARSVAVSKVMTTEFKIFSNRVLDT